MTVEFKPNDPSYVTAQGPTRFPDGRPMNRVALFIDNLPLGTPTAPFDSWKVRGRPVIAVDIIVQPHEIQLLRMPRRTPNPPPEPVQCAISNVVFKRKGLEAIVVHNNKDYEGRIFPVP